QQSEVSAWSQLAALPDVPWHNELRRLPRQDVTAEDSDAPTLRAKGQQLDGVAEVEVMHLVGWKSVQRGERVWCQEIVDRSADRFVGTVARRQDGLRQHVGRAVGLPVVATFKRQRAQFQKRDQSFSGEGLGHGSVPGLSYSPLPRFGGEGSGAIGRMKDEG